MAPAATRSDTAISDARTNRSFASFRADGTLGPDHDRHRDRGGARPTSLGLSDEKIDGLTEAEVSALIERLCRYPSMQSIADRVNEADARVLAGPPGQRDFLKAARNVLNWQTGEDREPRLGARRAREHRSPLEPGETKEIRFTVGWHFPYHYSAKGPVLGHMYENWFADAEAVNRFLVANCETHRAGGLPASRTRSTTPRSPAEFADAWAGQLTTLTKCTWWTKDGDFGVWEGLGCCGFHTTDITYQGSFNILALFPELQKRQMEMGARFQRADGRVHHFFTPDLARSTTASTAWT